MSVDKLVDSTLLDAACTYEAGKIREKLGSSAQIAYDLANGKGFGDAIAAIPTGGGGATAATGTITLASDFSLTTSAQNIPGLQLSFQPDFFYMIMDRTSFGQKATSSMSGGLWGLMAVKRTWSPPFATNATNTPETVDSEYTFFVHTGVVANSSIGNNGYGVQGGPSFLGNNFYGRYLVNSDGTVSVGRYSSASTVMKSGTYRYFAMKI